MAEIDEIKDNKGEVQPAGLAAPSPVEEVASVEETATTAEVAQVEEVAPVEEQTEPAKEDVMTSEEVVNAITDLKNTVVQHWATLRNVIANVKVKDKNVSKLSEELHIYRDGVEKSLFKSLALNIISFREDNKKLIRDFEESELSADNAKKYLRYSIDDFDTMFVNSRIEKVENAWTYNGKNINDNIEAQVSFDPELPVPAVVELDVDSVKTLDDVIELFKKSEQSVVEVMKDNGALDEILKKYIENSCLYEEGVAQVMLYPVVRRLIELSEKVASRAEKASASITEENAKAVYIGELQYIVDNLEAILYLCGVHIETYVSDEYDIKKNKILKMIQTDDESLNGVVESRITDCYTMDDKIIYPQRVSVYKYKK